MDGNMLDGKLSVAEKINTYQADVEQLIKYLPWLESKCGQDLFSTYTPEQATAGTMQVPVYDGTLLNFIKTVQKSKFMNKNYHYTYTRKRISNAKDELLVIDEAQIMDIELIGDILSKYVSKGMTKATVWTEGVQNGVFYRAVKKLRELIEYWTVPMDR